MNSNDSFYVTLPSNSSMNLYPKNTTSNFTTQLVEVLKLSGTWMVALVQISYPLTIANIYEKNQVITYKPEEDFVYKSFIPTGYFTIDELIKVLNRDVILKDQVEFKKKDNVISINILSYPKDVTAPPKPNTFTFEPKLTVHPDILFMMGFEENLDLDNNLFRARSSTRSPFTEAGVPDQIFVYTDIIQSQYVGDGRSPLLHVTTTNKRNYKYGSFVNEYVHNPCYYPIGKHEIESIEIDLRDNTGAKIPFSFGTSTVKLHFKKVS